MGLFLATTALTEFWDEEQDILCLGSWCLPYNRRAQSNGFRYSLMPSPWDDRSSFYRATQYLDAYAEYLLEDLIDHLNKMHGTQHGKKYWRILLGPWLIHSLHSTYDRYVHLRWAFEHYGDLQTLVLDPTSFRVPQNTKDVILSVCDDQSNLQLFSLLLQGMGCHFPSRPFAGSRPNSKEGSTSGLKRIFARGVRRVLESFIRRRFGRDYVALFDLNCPLPILLTIGKSSGFRIVPCEAPDDQDLGISAPVFDKSRENFTSLPSRNEFEKLFVQTLPYAFPVQFLEGYGQATEALRKKLKNPPRVILSAVNWYWNEAFKFFAAEASERGSRLVAAQHGGGYGVYRYSAFELHESRVADRFMVWGWEDSAEPLRQSLPNPTLSIVKDSHPGSFPAQVTSAILYLPTEHPRYLARFQSTPVGTQWEDYYQWIGRFLGSLSSELRASLRVRHNNSLINFGQATKERIVDLYPSIGWDPIGNIHESLVTSRLAVIDHHATVLLEALTINVPTLLFWDPQRWEVRGEAQPYFDELRRAGILWDSPEAAAAKLASVYDDPWAWWGSEPVQEVRRRFIGHYALGCPDWMTQWTMALQKEMAVR